MRKIGVIQMASVVGDVDANLAHSEALIRQAAAGGARLVVLPELCNTGYDLPDPATVQALAEPVPHGPTCRRWLALCAELNLYVAAGICERAGEQVYNSAVLLGPGGHVGTYRKAHLFARETELFTPGDTGFPVWETELGRLGMVICYDLRFPEALRRLALDGADIILVPTAWVVLAGKAADDSGTCMQVYCAMAHASMNQVVIACAGASGPFRSSRYLGNSVICGPAGWPLAGPAPAEGEPVLIAAVDVEAVRASRQRNPWNHTFGDRRLDLYGQEGSR